MAGKLPRPSEGRVASLANMSQKACGAAAVVVKDLEKIHKIADEGVNLFKYAKEERIQCRTCLVDKMNRDGTLMSSGRVHNLITDIVTEGFSEYKVSKGVVVDLCKDRR
jgi:hypothetical protein